MLDLGVCQEVLSRALRTGADYSEIYCSDDTTNSVKYIQGRAENATISRDRGVGIRILSGDRSVYAYSNDVSKTGLITLADTVADALGNTNVDTKDIVLNRVAGSQINSIVKSPADVSFARRVDIVKRGYNAAKKYSNEIAQVSSEVVDNTRRIFVANSLGEQSEDERCYVRYYISAVASNGVENQAGSRSPGCCSGFEFIDSLNIEELAEKAAEQAVTMLHAKPCPAGKMPVIVGNGFGGVLFHEACGHSLEATAVGKGNSVFCGKLGKRIANEKVTAIDDATMLSQWGSFNINDECEKPQKIVLIENGILKGYMIDRLGSRRMNMPSTGSGRRQKYTYAPTSRMSNTYIAAGKDSIEDIFSSVEYGLYCKQMGGGSVNPVTGEFNFAVSEGYIVKNGQIAYPVRGATLIGKGSEILMDIDMVSDNLKLAQGMCGSVSGSIPTNVGQPTLRISKITVGGAEA